MTRQPGHLNGAKNKNFRGSNENWRTGSTCVGFSSRTFYVSILSTPSLSAPCLLKNFRKWFSAFENFTLLRKTMSKNGVLVLQNYYFFANDANAKTKKWIYLTEEAYARASLNPGCNGIISKEEVIQAFKRGSVRLNPCCNGILSKGDIAFCILWQRGS